MHTTPMVFNPSMAPNYANPGIQIPQNSSFTYGAPTYGLPNYGAPMDVAQNYGVVHDNNSRYQVPRERSQGFPKKNYQGPKNFNNFQKDSHYHSNFAANGRNSRGNDFQRFPNRKPRFNESYHHNPMDNDYSEERLLQQSKKIAKPMIQKTFRREEGQRYSSRPTPNFSKTFSRRPRPEPQFEPEDPKTSNSFMFFKTKMCPHLSEGSCTRGINCNYAHSENELRDPPNLMKTRLCQLYQSGKCTRGNMCSFAHGEQELRSTPEFYKTSMCSAYMKGSCRAGKSCRFAHGEEELRSSKLSNIMAGVEKNPRLTDNYPTYSPSGMPTLSNDYNHNNPSYKKNDSTDFSLSKDSNRFIMNENDLHTYISNDTNTLDGNYSNTNQGSKGNKFDPNNRNDNLSQSFYNDKVNSYNKSDRSVSMNKPVGPQVDYSEITFHHLNPEKISSLFQSSENQNFLK